VCGGAGASGFGQITLLRLLQRFDDPYAGTIRLDDRDLRLMDPSALRDRPRPDTARRACCSIPRWRRTSWSAAPDAGPAEVMEAARAAGADDFIAGYPRAT